MSGWKKSSYSANNGNCAETLATDEGVRVRDSKDPGGPELSFSWAEWSEFTRLIRDGHLGWREYAARRDGAGA